MNDWLWTPIGFLLGMLPFAVWTGRLGVRKEIRDYGDGNPGAFNVIRAGGLAWGGLALALDVSKAAIPVGLANVVFGVTGLPLVTAALAPSLGHAFSPLLNFKGGKAIASLLGVWIGLTIWKVPLVGLVALVIWSLTLTVSGWAVMFMMATVLVFLLLIAAPGVWLAILFGEFLLMVWKHRQELRQPPQFRNPFDLLKRIRSRAQSAARESDSADPTPR